MWLIDIKGERVPLSLSLHSFFMQLYSCIYQLSSLHFHIPILRIFLLIATLSDCSELIESWQLFFAETAKILHSTYFPFVLRYFCVNIGTFPLELLNNCCTFRPAIQLIICIRHWQGELIRNGREPDFSPSRGKQSFWGDASESSLISGFSHLYRQFVRVPLAPLH